MKCCYSAYVALVSQSVSQSVSHLEGTELELDTDPSGASGSLDALDSLDSLDALPSRAK